MRSLPVLFTTFFLVLILSAIAPSCGFTEDSQQYQDLRAKYLKLRNTDARIFKAAEWERLARELVAFADKNKTSDNAAFALVDSTILYEKLYRRFGGTDRLQKAVSILDRVARDYPGHSLADDGLLRRGDLLLYEAEDLESAKRAYEEIVRAYPGSDMYPVARARLVDLLSGDWKKSVTASRDEDKQKLAAANKPLIVIDPGHGGEDYGGVGVAGLLEKDVTLSIAFALEKMLTTRLGAVVRLTRRRDVFVPLMDRTSLANDFEADLFISLHTNASAKKNLNGFEVYYLDNSGDKSSRTLAERENASVRFEGPQGDLQYMLSDLIQNAKLEDSVMLANIIHRSVQQNVEAEVPGMKFLGVKRAPFYVLVGAHMPCVLVEMFFLDNPNDGEHLADPRFRNSVAEGIFAGVRDFLERNKQVSLQ
jgi:N-acetylmuramoyl-L-alanine amidase